MSKNPPLSSMGGLASFKANPRGFRASTPPKPHSVSFSAPQARVQKLTLQQSRILKRNRNRCKVNYRQSAVMRAHLTALRKMAIGENWATKKSEVFYLSTLLCFGCLIVFLVIALLTILLYHQKGKLSTSLSPLFLKLLPVPTLQA